MNDDSRTNSKNPSTLERIILTIGHMSSWLIAILIVAILVQVILRYVFGKSFVVLEEIQWHIFAVIIMLGLSYSYVKDSHIRLDILQSKFSRSTREKIEIIGTVCFLWPMIFIFFMHGLAFVSDSFRVGEGSDAPMGLGYRWVIKSIIPIGFFLLFVGSLSRLRQAIYYLKNRKKSSGF